METLLREANENIRELQAEVETKSTALSHEKSENAASQSTIDRLKTEFEQKLNEREESLKKMFMRNGYKSFLINFEPQSVLTAVYMSYQFIWFGSVKSEIQAIKSDNSVKAQVTILETEFKKHVNDFMMIQSMNDANSMQHEEARRMAMKAVKSRLDEIQRKFR